MMEQALIQRIITALVVSVLRLKKRVSGDQLDPADIDRLERFEKIEDQLFSETEDIGFYAGQGLNIHDQFMCETLIKTPRKLRQEQLFRTALDGDTEQADLIKQANRKLGR